MCISISRTYQYQQSLLLVVEPISISNAYQYQWNLVVLIESISITIAFQYQQSLLVLAEPISISIAYQCQQSPLVLLEPSSISRAHQYQQSPLVLVEPISRDNELVKQRGACWIQWLIQQAGVNFGLRKRIRAKNFTPSIQLYRNKPILVGVYLDPRISLLISRYTQTKQKSFLEYTQIPEGLHPLQNQHML